MSGIPNEAVIEMIDGASAAAAKAERAAIVEWLRDNAGDEISVPAATLRLTANAVEAGEHLSHLKGNEG